MLRGEDRVATARRLFNTRAIEKFYSSTNGLNQPTILQLIGGLSNGCATCAEQIAREGPV